MSPTRAIAAGVLALVGCRAPTTSEPSPEPAPSDADAQALEIGAPGWTAPEHWLARPRQPGPGGLDPAACEAGSATACYALGAASALGIPPDPVSAWPYFRRACELGEAIGCFHAGEYADAELLADADDRLAAELYERGCELGSRAACTNLAQLLLTGEGIELDSDRGLRIEQEMCRVGLAVACNNVALRSIDVGDKPRALELFSQACARGHDLACARATLVRLGSCVGGEQTCTADQLGLDMSTLEQACAAGDGAACTEAGRRRLGVGQGWAYAEALELFEQGCASNDEWSCFLLSGSRRLLGDAGDPQLGRDVLEQACARGSMLNCMGLAQTLLALGELDEAEPLLRDACDAQLEEACEGLLTLCGLGSASACS